MIVLFHLNKLNMLHTLASSHRPALPHYICFHLLLWIYIGNNYAKYLPFSLLYHMLSWWSQGVYMLMIMGALFIMQALEEATFILIHTIHRILCHSLLDISKSIIMKFSSCASLHFLLSISSDALTYAKLWCMSIHVGGNGVSFVLCVSVCVWYLQGQMFDKNDINCIPVHTHTSSHST